MNKVVERVKKCLNNTLQVVIKDESIDLNLLDAYNVDSLQIVKILIELENEFDIEFDIEELEIENFISTRRICETIMGLIG